MSGENLTKTITEDLFLSRTELVCLTQARNTKDIISVLEAMGIPYLPAKQHPRVLRKTVFAILESDEITADSQAMARPNFSKLDRLRGDDVD